VTYPPDFHYITQQEVRTTMGSLAVEIATLDALLGSEAVANSENRDAVIASLTRMRSLAGQLKKGARSNHPRIGANAPRLREDIESALDGARRLPVPDYYDAGRVVGSCNYCHAPPLSSPRRG
jgi:hypothetical protein